MISVERTEDCALIESVVKHPRVWTNGIVHDAVPSRDNWSLPPGLLCLAVYKYDRLMGAVAMEDLGEAAYQAHLALLPVAWGPDSATCCFAVIDWMKEHTKARRIIATVPQFNRLCIALCKRIGMVMTARHIGKFRREGEPVDAEQYEVIL